MYKEMCDYSTGIKYIEVELKGKQLLLNSYLNKDTAFSLKERKDLELEGLLPNVVETLDEQVVRVYGQYLKKENDIERNIFLMQLYDRNETLFFRLAEEHLLEMMPVFYTPTVGEMVQQYNLNFRRPRGTFISYPQISRIEEILNNQTYHNIEVICVTDSEAILGIGDQGIGGVAIPISKLAMYTICADVNPNKVLPVVLDVGTNNKELLQNPLYLGWRHERIRGKQYDDFIEMFVAAVRKKFPHAYLHWEDFGKQTARKNLNRFKNEMPTFNDDMQGTAAVTLAAIMAGLKLSKQKISEQKVIVHGAGTAGCYIADIIVTAMISEGLSREEALSRMYLVDVNGVLLEEHLPSLEDFQKVYVKKREEFAENKLNCEIYQLEDVTFAINPTILIGTSTQKGAFTEKIVKHMGSYCERPMIFPLSNPTSRCEAHPSDLLHWTDGKALIATGSPFADVKYKDKVFPIGQCNNAFVFPGLGLGVVAAKPKRVSEEMILAAAEVISAHAQCHEDPLYPLLPSFLDIKTVSYKIAFEVIKVAQAQGLSESCSDREIHEKIKAHCWKAQYVVYKKGSK